MTPQEWDEDTDDRPTVLYTDESEVPGSPDYGTIEPASPRQVVVDIPDPVVAMARFAITACGITVAVTLLGWGALAAVVLTRWASP